MPDTACPPEALQAPDAASQPGAPASPHAALIVGIAGATFSVFGWFAIRWTETHASVLPWLILVCGLGSTLLVLGHVRSVERATKAIELANGRLRLEVEIRRASEASLRAAKDAAENADEAKSRFLASVSQDLRKPLNTVLRGLDRIQSAETDARRRQETAAVKRAATSTLEILDELLDLTQTQNDSLHDVSQSFDPHRLVQSVIEPLTAQARVAGLALNTVFEDGLPTAVQGSADRLRQVMTRLLNNALHVTRQGAVTVTTAVAPLNDHQVLLRIGVSDTSAGISMEGIARACGPDSGPDAGSDTVSDDASQVAYADLRRGLTIAHLLVRRMNGRLTVEHGAQGGSTFSIEVPVHPVVESALSEASKTYSLTPPTPGAAARPGGVKASL